MEKYFYTVGEVADILGESTSLVRFWANEFPKFIRPQRNAKGNRLFSKDDVETFKHIYLLVKVEGLTDKPTTAPTTAPTEAASIADPTESTTAAPTESTIADPTENTQGEA